MPKIQGMSGRWSALPSCPDALAGVAGSLALRNHDRNQPPFCTDIPIACQQQHILVGKVRGNPSVRPSSSSDEDVIMPPCLQACDVQGTPEHCRLWHAGLYPGWSRRRILGCPSLLAGCVCSIYGSKEVVIVCGRDDKAQQLSCKVVLRFCQGQLHESHTDGFSQHHNPHQKMNDICASALRCQI